MLYSSTNANFVLGSVLNNPSLLFSDKYKLNKADFTPLLFHKIIFVAIHNLAIRNAKQIDEIAISEWLSNYKAEYKIFENNEGIKFIQTIKKLSNDNMFEYYYNKLKVYSILREYKKQGFNIDEIYDETKDESEQNTKLDNYSVDSIINYFEKKQIQIKKDFSVGLEIEETYVTDDNVDEFLDELQSDPILGSGFPSLYLNSITRGWVRGHYNIFSTKTGFGKTTLASMMLTSVGVSHIYSLEQNKYISNPQYNKNNKPCYIHSEQTSKEIELRFLANISKVGYGQLMDGRFNTEERERIKQAKTILKNSGLKIINYPNFTVSGLKEIYKELALENYTYVVMDYLWSNGYVQDDHKKTMSLANTSEPTTLLYLSNALKQFSEEYLIGTLSMTQTNGKELNTEIVGADAIYGARSIATKPENAFVAMQPTNKTLSMLQNYIQEYNSQNGLDLENYIEPNIVFHVYKGRYNRFGTGNIKIFSHLNRGTGELTEMFCTTGEENSIIKIPKLMIKGNEIV